jgi:hypothetical protein
VPCRRAGPTGFPTRRAEARRAPEASTLSPDIGRGAPVNAHRHPHEPCPAPHVLYLPETRRFRVHLMAVKTRDLAFAATHAPRPVDPPSGPCFRSNFERLGPLIADPPELRFVCSPSKSCYGGRRERRGSDVGPHRREKVYADLCDQERPRLTPAVPASPRAPTPSRPQQRSSRLTRGSTEPDPIGACRARGLKESGR